jgi:hypothetical protein
MTALLETRRPARQQYDTRRALVTAYLVHTAENILDELGPDTGAEGVAEFIATRSDAGSYHDLADSDSVVEVIPPRWQAFHCRGGVNPWTMGLSFACRSVDWPRMTPERRAGFLRNGARVAALRVLWIEDQEGWAAHARARGYAGDRFPVRWITKQQADDGESGFVGHGQMDPGRRSDPGPLFPQDEFLGAVRVALDIARREAGQTPGNGDEEMPKTWGLVDLGATMESVGTLYEADAHRRMAGADPLSYEVRPAVVAGRAAWLPDVIQLLQDGKDPNPTLAYIRWQLANPDVKL